MLPEKFIALELKPGQKVKVCLRQPDGGTRTLTLFFRGYKTATTQSVDIIPRFSVPNRAGGMSRKYYKAVETTFENIIHVYTNPNNPSFPY